MNIAFPCPSYWPYVRRGAERCIHDLAQFLAHRGHEVRIITSTPGRSRTAFEGDVRVIYLRQLSHPILYRHSPLVRLHAFGVAATRLLIKEPADVAHLHSYSGIAWASLLRRVLRMPYLLQLIVLKHYWPGRLDRFLFPQVVRRADSLVALTRGGAKAAEAEYGVPCGILPPPIDMDTFRPCAQRDVSNPKVLFTGDLADLRKGGILLLRAWNKVHRECPEATLVLGGSLGLGGFNDVQAASSTLARLSLVKDPAARGAIELWGPGNADDLPSWYSQAAVTVLPSIEEAFGMVLTESLACGTPVVASAHGGPGEIITNHEIGATVDLEDWPDLRSAAVAEQLADAILYAIGLSRNSGTADKCREWASQWSIDRVGLEEERLLQEIVGSHLSKLGPQVAAPVRTRP